MESLGHIGHEICMRYAEKIKSCMTFLEEFAHIGHGQALKIAVYESKHMTRESKNEQKGHEQALRIAVYEGEHMTCEGKNKHISHEAHMRCASKIKSHRPGIQKSTNRYVPPKKVRPKSNNLTIGGRYNKQSVLCAIDNLCNQCFCSIQSYVSK